MVRCGPVGGGVAGAAARMVSYQMDARRCRPSGSGARLTGASASTAVGSSRRRAKLSNCEASSLFPAVRQRHAGVQRRGHRLVVAEEDLRDRMSERALDLRRRNRIRLGGSIEQHANPIAGRAELTDAIEQPLRVADRRHVGVGDEEDRVRGVERRDRAGVHLRAGVHDDVLVLAAEHTEHLFERAAVGGARTIEEIRSGEDLEPGLVLDHELLHELLIEPVQVVERVQHRVAAAHAQEESDLAQAGLQIDDQRRPLLQPGDLDGGVHGERGRAGAALGAEEHHRRGLRARRRRRGPTCRRPPQRLVKGLRGRRPREELVGPGAHRLNDQVGVHRGGDREDAGIRPASAQLLDGRHRRRVTGANVDDHHVRRGGLCRVLVDETSRHGARPEAPCEAGDEFFVVADDQCVELRHSYPFSAGAAIARIAWRAQPDTPLPKPAAGRPPRRSPAAAPAASRPDAWPPRPASSPRLPSSWPLPPPPCRPWPSPWRPRRRAWPVPSPASRPACGRPRPGARLPSVPSRPARRRA